MHCLLNAGIFFLVCNVLFFYYTKQAKICHRNADGSPWLYFPWKEWHYILFQSMDKVSCKVNCPLCMSFSWEFYLYIWVLFLSVFVPKILCLCVPSRLSRLFLLPFTASVFGACVCVSKRYTIDGWRKLLFTATKLAKSKTASCHALGC